METMKLLNDIKSRTQIDPFLLKENAIYRPFSSDEDLECWKIAEMKYPHVKPESN